MGNTTVPVTAFTTGKALMLRGQSASKKISFGQSFQTTFIHSMKRLIYTECLVPAEPYIECLVPVEPGS